MCEFSIQTFKKRQKRKHKISVFLIYPLQDIFNTYGSNRDIHRTPKVMTKQSLKGNLMFMLAMEIILGSYNWSLVSGIAVIPPRQCATTEEEDLRRGGGGHQG